jgi:hypothetical protein
LQSRARLRLPEKVIWKLNSGSHTGILAYCCFAASL